VRASRLVSLLLLLQTRGNMSAPDLARELEVSVRTVYRDVEALSSAGVPVYAESGRGGGFRLVEGYRTRLTGLSAKEAEALLLGGTPGPVGELGLGTVFAAAQAKLLAALPKEVADRAFLVRRRFHLDSANWFRSARVPPHLGAVSSSVWEERRLEIVYRHPGSDDGARRVLDPLGLVLKAGVWYLVAARDGETRTYRVSRIQKATVLDEPSPRPADFDLARYWADSVASYEMGSLPTTVTVRATGHAVGALRRRGARPQLVEPDDDDGASLHCTVTFENLEDALRELLGLGGEVEVIDPVELREALRESAQAVVEVYSTNGHAPAGTAPIQDAQPARGPRRASSSTPAS
jgi:predicted DNA-binding transcriptional regulator YafY